MAYTPPPVLDPPEYVTADQMDAFVAGLSDILNDMGSKITLTAAALAEVVTQLREKGILDKPDESDEAPPETEELTTEADKAAGHKVDIFANAVDG